MGMRVVMRMSSRVRVVLSQSDGEDEGDDDGEDEGEDDGENSGKEKDKESDEDAGKAKGVGVDEDVEMVDINKVEARVPTAGMANTIEGE